MKKVLLFIVSGLVLLAIPATVLLVNQRQELRKRAAPATKLSFSPSKVTKAVGDTFSLDVLIDTADNQVAAAELNIAYDFAKLEALTITNGPFAPAIVSSGKIDNAVGTATITVGANNATQPIKGTGTIASIQFKALQGTDPSVSIRFASTTYVGALGEGSKNVLIGTEQATVTITGGTGSGSGGTAAQNGAPSPTPTPATIRFGDALGNTYVPAQLTVKVGDTVEWQGNFASHPLVSPDNLWQKQATGTSFSHTFAAAGTYHYYCEMHGSATAGMKGQIIVTSNEATPTPTPTATPDTSQGSSATASAVAILSPDNNESVKTETPTFQGKAPPGSTVTIVIHSSGEITATVTADANGNWSYTPTTPLGAGPHTVVASALDPATGATQTTTTPFVVTGGIGGASESAIPVSGSTEITFLLIGVALLFIVTGALVPIFVQ